MSRSPATLWIIAIALGAGVLIVTGSRAAAARTNAQRARRDLTNITQQAIELARLRGSTSSIPDRPEGGLTSKVSAAMSRAGLAGSILQSLSPEARASVTGAAGAKLLCERATLTLAGLSLPQVGTFLAAWRTAEPDWIISSIGLTPITSGPENSASALGTDLPLRAVLTIEGVFRDSLTNAGGSR